jgi:hypothetical protein
MERVIMASDSTSAGEMNSLWITLSVKCWGKLGSNQAVYGGAGAKIVGEGVGDGGRVGVLGAGMAVAGEVDVAAGVVAQELINSAPKINRRRKTILINGNVAVPSV